MKIENIIKYIADDGKEFFNEKECSDIETLQARATLDKEK